jgi:hypothetical protein
MYPIKRNFKSSIVCLVIYCFAIACTQSKKDESKDSVSLPTAKQNLKVLDSNNITLVDKVLLATAQQERLALIGKKITELTAIEGVAASETTNGSLSFSHYLTELQEEFIDITYAHNGQNVQKITIDVFLNQATDVASLYKECELFFTKKHNKPKGKSPALYWTLKQGKVLSLKDVSEKLAPGIQITIGPQQVN